MGDRDVDEDARQLDEDARQLQARVDNLERMAARLAHELTTPLTTAHGFTSVLLGRPDLAPDVRDVLERIERATEAALAMLRSRLDEGVGERPRSVRLRALVRDAVSATLGEEAPAGRQLDAAARVFGDPAAMRTALELLLDALADHMAANDVDPSILAVTLTPWRPTTHVVRFAAACAVLPAAVVVDAQASTTRDSTTIVGRLQHAQALLGAVGGRLWLEDPTAPDGQLSVLLQLPRDVEADAVARPGTGNA